MKFTLILIVAVLCGCVQPASHINKVQIGMAKSDVVRILGEPSSATAENGYEYLNYSLAENPVATPQASTPYYVRLANGKVDSYGRAGESNNYRPHTVVVPVVH